MSTSDNDFRATAPEPTAPRPYRFPDVVRETLPNGLRVLVAENHNAPMVSIRALLRSGADHDGDHPGLASFTADLLDEGAGDRDGVQLAEDLGFLGAGLGTGADWDASYVSLDVLTRNLDASVGIFADVVQRPTFPPDAIERVRNERLMDLIQQKDEAAAIASKRFSGFLFSGTTYGTPVIGNAESIAAITRAEVERFYRANYNPNNASFVVAGDIEASRALDIVRETFSSWEPGAEPEHPPIVARPVEASRIYLIDRPQAVQSEIRIGHAGVPRNTEDYFPLFIMNALLGGVFNSRINLNLRERHGYTYGARSQFAFRRHAGPFVVAAPVRNEVTKESVSEVLHELREIRSGEVTDAELGETKSYLMGVFPATVQSATDIASRLLDMELYDFSQDYFDRYRENIAAVTRADVARVAQKYIDPERLLIVIVGSAKTIREPLGSLGIPIREYDIEGKAIEEAQPIA